MDTSTLLHTCGYSVWVAQAHGVLLYMPGRVARVLAFDWLKENLVVNNNQAIRDAHPAGWISGVGLCCHVQLWTLNSHGQTCVKQTATEGWIDELPCLPKLLIKIDKTLCSGPLYRLLFSCKRLKKSTWVEVWPRHPGQICPLASDHHGLLTIPISTDWLHHSVSSPPVSWYVVGYWRTMAAVASSRWMLHTGEEHPLTM